LQEQLVSWQAERMLKNVTDQKKEIGNENNIPRLTAIRRELRMGLGESKRPVVLIVEDEFLVRMDAVDIVKAAGFDAVEARNADQAVEILESRNDITVVFTDIQMPGSMDGLNLARAVRGRWPPIKIVATSGHANVRGADLPEGGRFVPKPYSPMQIKGLLRELTSGA
jgi:CheY-like chemotaxis protein